MNIDVATRVETSATLSVNGRLDALSSPDLRQRLANLESEGIDNILVDLSDIDFVDSAGLAALISGMKAARLAGGDVELVRPRSDEAYRVFELTKFDAVFVIHQAD